MEILGTGLATGPCVSETDHTTAHCRYRWSTVFVPSALVHVHPLTQVDDATTEESHPYFLGQIGQHRLLAIPMPSLVCLACWRVMGLQRIGVLYHRVLHCPPLSLSDSVAVHPVSTQAEALATGVLRRSLPSPSLSSERDLELMHTLSQHLEALLQVGLHGRLSLHKMLQLFLPPWNSQRLPLFLHLHSKIAQSLNGKQAVA
jgi:hypothetical protein